MNNSKPYLSSDESSSLPEQNQTESTPYTRTPEELDGLLTDALADESYVFMDGSTHPDLGNKTILMVPSTEKASDIGKTLEAKIFNKDNEYSTEFIEEMFSPYDDNSEFLMLVDNATDNPRVVGILRLIDCTEGPSETTSMFHEFYGEDTPLPPEMQPEDDEKLWDILTIVMEHSHRDGVNSAWLYHALYQKALDEGVHKWIANVTPNEMRNLREYIGIPFREIPDAPEVTDVSPETGKESKYGFYWIRVEDIETTVKERITDYEKLQNTDESDQMTELLHVVANIALHGRKP